MTCQLVRILGVSSKDPSALDKIAPYKGMTVVAPDVLPSGVVEGAMEMFYEPEYRAEYEPSGSIRPIGTGMDYFKDMSGYYYIVATHAVPAHNAEKIGDIMEIFMVDCSLPGKVVPKFGKFTPLILGAVIGTAVLAAVIFR